jgi:hypothetical protein
VAIFAKWGANCVGWMFGVGRIGLEFYGFFTRLDVIYVPGPDERADRVPCSAEP